MDRHLRRDTLAVPDTEAPRGDQPRDHNAVEYDSKTETYRAFYDAEVEPVCRAVISTVAAVSDTDPLELDPLHNAIETDALTAMFEPSADSAGRGDVSVTFQFEGYEVSVFSYGSITVRPLDGDASTSL